MHDEPSTSEGPSPLGDAPVAGADELALELMQRRILAKVFETTPEPVRVDRFVLEREIGAGGMGSVWLARDEQLGRAVALKFLRGASSAAHERRLLEEAQSLAKLSHPNVIPVFDAGRHVDASGERVWIAMEFVPGRTLRAWIEQERPSASERLRAWIDAGRGIAAIHEAGLIHRDVKPDNVLIGDDGRVRVIDLGLVRRFGESSGGETLGSTSGAGDEVTIPGAFVGTPAYAAPEQRRGQPIDARADQYAFCVAVWEGLCGQRPAHAARARRPSGMPRRIHRALARGLRDDPGERFEHMHALLAALAPRRRFGWVAAGLVLALGSGVASSWALRPEDREPCVEAARALDQRWTEARRAVTLARIDPDLRGRVEPALDEWTDGWRAAARRSCEEVHVEQLRSPASLDRRRACLGERLAEFEVLVDAIGPELDGASVSRWLAALERPSDCLRDSLLSRTDALASAAQAGEAERIHAEQFALRIDADATPLATRREQARRTLDAAEALGLARSIGQAKLLVGDLALYAGDADEARAQYGALIDLASASDDDLLLARAWHGQTSLAILLEHDVEAARWAAQREREVVRALGDPPRERGLALLDAAAIAYLGPGDLAGAEVDLRAAIEAFEQLGGEGDWHRAAALRNLAQVLSDRGDHDRARALHEQADALERGGARVPGAAAKQGSYNRLKSMVQAGEFAAVEPLLVEAVDEVRARFGPRSPELADIHALRATVLVNLGELGEAREQATLADAIYRERFGADAVDRYEILTVLGTIEFWSGDFARAAAVFERAVLLAELEPEFDPVDLAYGRANLGEALSELGELARAQVLLERARDDLVRLRGLEDPGLAIPRKALGAVYLARDDPARAEPELRAALAQLDAGPVTLERAHARWLLAQTLGRLDRLEPALAAARLAVGDYAELGAEHEQARALVQGWIDERAR